MIAVLLPAAFNAVQPTYNVGPLTSEKKDHDILSISHGVCKSSSVCCPSELTAVYPQVAVILLFSQSDSVFSLCPSHTVITILTFLVYICYLWFQLVSHKNLYDDNILDAHQSVEYPSSIRSEMWYLLARITPDLSSLHSADNVSDLTRRDASSLEAGLGGRDDEVEKPEMGLHTTIALLAIVTLVCRSCSLPLGGLIVLNSSLPSPLCSSSIP